MIGSQTLHAVGYALGIQRDAAGSRPGSTGGEKPLPVAWPTSVTAPPARGTSTRRSSWPRVYNAPVVFFCQNNQWAISQPRSGRPASRVYRRADGFGFPGVRVDGNDVLAVLGGH